MRYFLVLLLCFLLYACEKQNPNVVYHDYQYSIIKINDTILVCMPKQPDVKPFVINLKKNGSNNVIEEGEEQ